VNLSVAVQHHPSRAHRLAPLTASLGCSAAVVSDPDPLGGINPWRSSRECWRRTPTNADWRLVVQDDALPCRDFYPGVLAALAAAPGPICAFYLGENPRQTARVMRTYASWGASWVPGQVGDWVPCVALAMHTALALDLARYESGTTVISDDEIIGRWAADRHHPWFSTIPSLVQHDDDEPSIIGGHVYHPGARQAACWIGDYSALQVDWSRL
jgi:hypothetical protein